MSVRDTGDPRLQQLFGLDELSNPGVRPVVSLPRSGPPNWMIAAGAILAALILFIVLESRRTATPEPPVSPRAGDAPVFAPEPPPLYIPPAPAPPPPIIVAPTSAPETGSAPLIRPQAPPAPLPMPQTSYYPAEPAMPAPMLPPPEPTRTASGPAMVIDASGGGAPPAAAGEGAAASSLAGGAAAGRSGTARRARSSALANRSMTVAQGTVIPAVLETAFDSTRPGFARAIVSRHVRGFDGKRILVPRGSRLVGEYSSDVSPGQKRAMISWTRLIRPDGTMIAIDSPAIDPLGRGGVRASVDTHFFQRFTGALLQSVVDFGQVFASRRAATPIIVAAPGAAAGAPASITVTQSNSYTPTLKVAAGKSISVFVAHDLEFGEGPGR